MASQDPQNDSKSTITGVENNNQDIEASMEVTSLQEKHPEPPPQMTFPEGGVRAWSVALGTAGALFSTFGYANSFGVFQEFYETHQLRHESPSAISWIGSIQIFFLFGGTLFGGPLFDRYGAKVVWPPAFSYIISVMLTSVCKKYYQFMLAQGILGGFSMGMTMAPGIAATGQYFNKNRGAALGIAVAGSSLGGVVFPIALSKMLYNPSLGFGWTVRICGFLMLALLGPACVGIRARLPPRTGTFFIPAAFKSAHYVSIIASTFLMMLGALIPLFYLPTYAVEHGMSTLLASYLVSIMNAASFVGRVVPGVLADKFGRLNGLCLAGVSTGILALCWQRITTNSSIIVFAVLYGFSSGAIFSLLSASLAQVPENPGDIGTYLGMGMAVVSVASLIGPPINGAILSKYHSFDQVSTFTGVVVIAGGLGIIFAKHTSSKGVFGKI